jgi:hypothetical protein
MAQQFSAEIVDPRGTITHSKIFVHDGKVRFNLNLDPPGLAIIFMRTNLKPEAGEPFQLIVDRREQVTYVVLPSQSAFLKSFGDPTIGGGPFHDWIMLRPFDPENPCEAWMKKAKETCRSVGDVTINGRNTVEFDVFSPKKKRKLRLWFDAELGWVVKLQNEQRMLELRDIRVESQAYTLFEVPLGYKEIKPEPLKWWEKIPIPIPIPY